MSGQKAKICSPTFWIRISVKLLTRPTSVSSAVKGAGDGPHLRAVVRIKCHAIREEWVAHHVALSKRMAITVGGCGFGGGGGVVAQTQAGIELGGADTGQRHSMTGRGVRNEGGMADRHG